MTYHALPCTTLQRTPLPPSQDESPDRPLNPKQLNLLNPKLTQSLILITKAPIQPHKGSFKGSFKGSDKGSFKGSFIGTQYIALAVAIEAL